MNILKTAIMLTSVTALSFAQIPNETVTKHSDIRISKKMTFQAANVDGNFGNTNTTLVTGTDFYDTMDLKLSRSFKQELSCNVDRETIERMF